MTKTATKPTPTKPAAKKDGSVAVTKAAVTAAKEITKSHSRETRDVPLSALYLHEFNPRKSVKEDEIDALALSIQILTLMQNLVGIEEDGPEGKTIGIVGGGRRMRALLRLAEKEGADPATITAPVKLAKDRPEAQAWASAENAARVELHPATEIDSYRQMIDGGAPVRTIAKAFAVSEKHVEGRLKLAALAEPVLKALAADQLTIEQAKAFTLAPDTQTQAELLDEVLRCDADPRRIRSSLTHESVREGRGLGSIITRAEYEAEGGATRVDMFEDTAYFDDDAAIQKALAKKLKSVGAEIEAEGWNWVEVRAVRMGYDDLSDFGRLYPEQVEISEAEEAEYNELADAIENESATEDQTARFDALEAKISEEAYSEKQRKFAGVVVGFDYRNELTIARGMVRKEDRKAAIDAGVLTKGYEDRRAEQVTKKPEGYSAAVISDLVSIRTAAVQQALLANPRLALDLATFALSEQIGFSFPCDIKVSHPSNTPGQKDGFAPDERIADKGPREWLNSAAAAKRFAAFRAKTEAERETVLTEAVALSLRGNMAGKGADAIFESIATETKASVRAVWTPTADAFFKRLTRPDLVKIWNELHARKDGEAVFGKRKKGEMVSYMHALFNDPKMAAQLPKETQARIDVWLPKDMAFAPARKPSAKKKAAPRKAAAKKKPAAKKPAPAKS